ncbi:MAG: regulatory iron-sulfur-containing complex subunit RicT [Tepidiformaceae bacterium]
MPDYPSVAGVRFRNAGKIFYFHTAGMRLDPGEYVVVETSRGPEIARVVIGPEQVVVNELGDEELKPILRLATDDDIRRADGLKERAKEVLPEARRLAEETGFPGHIEAAEFTLDGRRLTVSFSSEERLDYRGFLRRAGERFGAKVDMRQLGARDRAKLAGGYGVCGRELCCSSWLTTFPSISIRMAKDQELPLNPQKISGLCGRLLCCLSYEDEGYREMRKTLPKIGQRCSTPTGEGKVIGLNILRRQVTLLVDGQRVEVVDRDLGLVVRWDTASKAGAPPPSISRVDAIAQGLIEATEEDLAVASAAGEPADWITQGEPAALPGPGRGMLPCGGPRRVLPAKPRDEAPRPPGRGDVRGGPRPQAGSGGVPGGPLAGRVFQRSGDNPPPRPRDADAVDGSHAPEEGGARRRGRRGRGGRGG